MSKTVDERVVSMQFDNKNFEANVQTSMSTLDKLKQKLNLTGAVKGLAEIDSASKKLDFSGLSNAVQTVHAKFSALEIMGITALTNITNSAINAGKRIVSALTIDPIKTGFSEYETQINSVQTILANTQSKGTTLQDVNQALDELNTYADKTIYNFTEMTRNIGTFTAAGIELDDSVSSIQGIANLAAVSGSTSQQASTAMYQLSQALSSGSVKLQDWNSVVNAGMGGQVFQDALKRTATVMGTNVDAMIEKAGSFRESLKDGWITADVLTETLNQFTMAAAEGSKEWETYKKSLKDKGYTEEQATEILKMANTATDAATKVKTFTQLWDTLKETAQSGWTQTWEIIVGDFEEAKKFLTDISNTIGPMIDAMSASRNQMLEEGLSSGWDQLLGQGITDEQGYKDAIKEVAKANKVSIDDMIKKQKELDSTLTDGEAYQKALAAGFKDGSITSDMMSESVTKLADKMRKMSAEERKAAGYTDSHILKIEELEEGLKNGTISMDEFVEKIQRPSGRQNLIDALRNSFDGLMQIVKPIKEAFEEIFPAMTGEQLYEITQRIKELTEKFKITEEQAAKIKETFKGLFSIVAFGVDIVKAMANAAGKIVSAFFGYTDGLLSLTSSIGGFLSNLYKGISDADLLNKSLGGVADFIAAIAKFAGDLVSSGFGALGSVLGSILKVIGDIGVNLSKAIASVGDGLGDAFRTGGIHSVLELVNSGILSSILLKFNKFITGLKDTVEDNTGGIFGKFKDMLDNVCSALDTVRSSLQTWQTNLKVKILLKIAAALGILAVSIAVLASIDGEKLTSALSAMTMMFIELTVAMTVMSRLSGSIFGAASTVTTMIGVAAAILILASALKKLSSLSYEEIARGAVGVAALATIVVVTAKAMSSGTKGVIKGAMGINAFGSAMLILANVCGKLAALSWDEMTRGLVGVGVLVAEMIVFSRVARFEKRMISTAISMAVLGAAMKILASVCTDLAVLSDEEIGKGILAIGVLLTELVAFSKLTSGAKGLASVSMGLVLISFGMSKMVSVFQALSQLSLEGIGKSLLAIAGVLTAFGLAARLLPETELLFIAAIFPVIADAMETLATALGLMDHLSWEGIAKGIVGAAGSLVLISIAMAKMEKSLLGAAGLVAAAVALSIFASVLETISGIGALGLAVGLVGLVGIFAILTGAIKVLKPLIPSLMSLSGSIATLGLSFAVLGTGMTVIGTGLLSMVTSLVAALLALQGLSWGDMVKGIITLASVFTIIGVAATLLKPLVPTILSLSGSIALLGFSCMSMAMAVSLIAAGLSSLALVGEDAVVGIVNSLKALIVGVFKSIDESMPYIINAVEGLLMGIIDIFVKCVPALTDALLFSLMEILRGLSEYGPQIIDFLMKFLIDIINGLAESIPKLFNAISNLVNAIFKCLSDAFKNFDSEGLVKGVGAVWLVTLLMNSLAGVVATIPMAMAGLLGVGAIIAEMALIIAAIGALAQIPGLQWLIDQGGGFLQSVGSAIGKFIGGIAGGLIGGFSSNLPQIGSDLSSFMSNVKGFIDGAKLVDGAVLSGAKALAETILILTAANVIEGLTSWFTGGSSISAFGSELAGLGTNLKDFSDNLGDFDEGKARTIGCAANAIKSIAEAASEIPNEGGWAGVILGENSIADFGSKLPDLGTNLGKFAKNLGTFNDGQVSTISCAATAIKDMAMAADLIPNEGGWVAKLVGENSIADFGSKLPDLGTNLNSFATNLGTFTDGQVNTVGCAANAIKSMAEAAKEIDGQPGWAAAIFGDDSLATFGEKLGDLGTNLKTFATNLGSFSESQVSTIYCAVRAIDAFTGLAGTDLGDMTDDLSEFGVETTTFATNLRTFCTTIPSSGAIDTATENLSRIMSLIEKIIKMDADSIANFTNALGSLGTDGVGKFTRAFTADDAKNGIHTAAADLVMKAIDGVNSKVSLFTKAFTTMINSALETIRSKINYANFSSAASYLVDGFCGGIRTNVFKAEAEARVMARAALDAAKQELDEHSPSKAFYEIGDYAGQGFVNALGDYVDVAYKSSAKMAGSAKDGLSYAIGKVSDIINSDMDAQPTIRPVVDLSDVTDGVNSINGLFGGTSIGLNGNISAISTMMNRRNQNGPTDDVISAIDKLRKDIGNINNTSYNIGGITYDDGSNIADAIKTLIRAAKIERRV